MAPRSIARAIGVGSNARTALRLFGMREVVSGLAILARPGEPAFLWARVAGDAIDLAALQRAAGWARRRRLLSAGAVLGIAALDVAGARRLQTRGVESENTAFVDGKQAMTINAPHERVEDAWAEWCASGQTRLRGSPEVRLKRAPGARGTEVWVQGSGRGGEREELRRFKQWVETGEVMVSTGPSMWHAARPAAEPNTVQELSGVHP